MEAKHYTILKDGTITVEGHTVIGDWSQTLCEHSFCTVGSNSCKCCPAFGSIDEEKQIVQCKYDDFVSVFGKNILQQAVKWRKCKAGYKFPSDAIVIPDDERTSDRDPRLVRCAVWDSKYILIDDLKKLPIK